MTIKEFHTLLGRNIKVFSQCKEKVLGKFLEMMVRGILEAKSILLADIARALEPTSLTSSRHIFKRLDRNLGKLDVTGVKRKAQAKQCALIDNETFILFDPTEVIKPYGKKFEAISHVADGSDGRKSKPGYHVNACVALKGNELIPLEWEPYSSAAEQFVSENDEVLQTIDHIAHRSRGRGIFVLDRGFDRFAIIRHMHQLSVSFIIRMMKLRHYRVVTSTGVSTSMQRHEVFKHPGATIVRTRCDVRVHKVLQKRPFTIRAHRVLLSEDIDSPRPLTLIRAKNKSLMTIYLLTNLEDITQESIVSIFEGYLARWKVEEFIRFVKQTYHAERFMVRDLGRIKNLHAILFLALVILMRTVEQQHLFSKIKALIIKHAKRVFPIPQNMKFFFYTFADGVAELMKRITKPLLNLWSIKQKRQLALPIVCST
jgi:hypothetical protein